MAETDPIDRPDGRGNQDYRFSVVAVAYPESQHVYAAWTYLTALPDMRCRVWRARIKLAGIHYSKIATGPHSGKSRCNVRVPKLPKYGGN